MSAVNKFAKLIMWSSKKVCANSSRYVKRNLSCRISKLYVYELDFYIRMGLCVFSSSLFNEFIWS